MRDGCVCGSVLLSDTVIVSFPVAVFLAPAPVKITSEKIALYEAKVAEVSSMMPDLSAAESRLMDAELHMKDAMVWFWRFREKDRARVNERRPAVDAARKDLKTLRKQRDGVLREAKAALGLWSEAGIGESRALLWKNFNAGKDFAKRQSIWDAFFVAFDSRDKDWPILLLRILISTLMNYSIGAVTSAVSFAFSLPSLLASFAPSWTSATLFYSVALLGAVSVVAGYLALLFAAGTAVVATTAAVVSQNQQRLANERRRTIRNRDHYD